MKPGRCWSRGIHALVSTYRYRPDLPELNSFFRFFSGTFPTFFTNPLYETTNTIEYKLSVLQSGKWKKVYQAEGQGLVRVNFYPHEVDWARLSVLSNATGYSRCFLFVYLMELDLKKDQVQHSRTLPTHWSEIWIRQIFCAIMLDERENLLVRVLRT